MYRLIRVGTCGLDAGRTASRQTAKYSCETRDTNYTVPYKHSAVCVCVCVCVCVFPSP